MEAMLFDVMQGAARHISAWSGAPTWLLAQEVVALMIGSVLSAALLSIPLPKAIGAWRLLFRLVFGLTGCGQLLHALICGPVLLHRLLS